MSEEFVRFIFRVGYFCGAAFLELALCYRTLHERGARLPWRDFNKVVMGIFVCNSFLVAYYGVLVFGISVSQTAPIITFWIAVFGFLELLLLGVHFFNGAVNRAVARWINRFGRLLQWTQSFRL